MVETTTNSPQNEAKMERFEFVLTVNGNIVCQRYFRISGYRNESANSLELVDAVNECVNIIDSDLKRKSLIWSHFTSPQVFNDMDEAEKWFARHTLKVPTFVVVGENVYVYNGSDNFENALDIFEKRFNINDYVKLSTEEETKNTLKFAIYDNDYRNGTRKELCSKIWDANAYPRFVRTNIDLSNQKNKYKQPDFYSMFEGNVIDLMNRGGNDLIPTIVHTICDYLSEDEDFNYTVSETYGNTKYNFNISDMNYKYIRSLERAYKAKTEQYKKELF